MIDLYLSTDGKHTVHLSAETSEEVNKLLVKALGDKQDVAFSGGATVMKIIGG